MIIIRCAVAGELVFTLWINIIIKYFFKLTLKRLFIVPHESIVCKIRWGSSANEFNKRTSLAAAVSNPFFLLFN